VAVEVAAGFGGAFGFEFALGFAASVPWSIGGCHSLGELPRSLLARPAKVNDLAHPALDEPLRVMQVPHVWLRGQIRPYRGGGLSAKFPPVKALK
jgi:hypothetical protein